jgi:two-component system, cell cycle response regulator DivK
LEPDVAGERVLIVDDNPFNTKLARHLLTADGFDVCTAETADDVTAAFASGRPRLILMDLHLRGTDGLTLTRSLRSHPENADIVIIAFSSDVTHTDGQRLLEAGCDGYIQKPIDVHEFSSVVRRYLTSKR